PRVLYAYNVCSDLGLVARALAERGPEGLTIFRPTPGRPVRPALADRLASPESSIRRLGTVIAEPKYDGIRLQMHRDGERVWLYSRRLEELTDAFPSVVAAVREQIGARRAILDGEVVVYDPNTGDFVPFQVTARR